MKDDKYRRKRDPSDDVFDFDGTGDAMFGHLVPKLHLEDEFRQNNNLHPELQKLVYGTMPEIDHNDDTEINEVSSERDAQIYDDIHQGAIGYYKAKKAFFDDQFENRMQYSTMDYLQRKEVMEVNDYYMN